MANSQVPPVKQQFTAITLLSMAFVICNSWAGIAGSLQLALLAGGPVTLVYSIIVSTSAYLSIAASMAELASVYPTAGGQYHFTSILAPQQWKRSLSYSCGVLALLSWLAIGVSVTVLVAEQLLALVENCVAGFVTKSWHVFLVYQGFAFFAMLYNAFILKRSPWTHNIGFFLTISLFITSFIGLLIRADPKQPEAFVWKTFLNYTGWPDGICFFIGLSSSCYMYNGLDASMHMAEECSRPKEVVPRTIMTAILIGFTTAFAYAVAQLYGISNIEEIMTTSQWIPFVAIEQGFRSRTFALVLVALTVVMAVFIIFAIQETSSRLVWALARDEGLVFSQYLQQIHPLFDVPLWGLLLIWILTFACGFLYLASKAAFNAVIGSSVILQQLSFGIPIVLLLVQKRSNTFLPSTRSFRLPNLLGWIVNTYAVLFITFMTVILCLPVTLPTNGFSMNYTSVILGISFLLSVINWWLHARKHYSGPTIELLEASEFEQDCVSSTVPQPKTLISERTGK